MTRPSCSSRTFVREFEDVPEIESFPIELNQDFITLLLNAGEVIEGEGSITISTSGENGRVRISVSNTGREITKDRLDKIFDIGFTEKGSKMRLHVGLANVHAVVQKHWDEIKVKSELQKGTTFEILLPIRQGLSPSSPPSVPERSFTIMSSFSGLKRSYPGMTGADHWGVESSTFRPAEPEHIPAMNSGQRHGKGKMLGSRDVWPGMFDL